VGFKSPGFGDYRAGYLSVCRDFSARKILVKYWQQTIKLLRAPKLTNTEKAVSALFLLPSSLHPLHPLHPLQNPLPNFLH